MAGLRRGAGWTFCLVVALSHAGCGPTPVNDPLAQLLNRDKDPALRLATAQQLGAISDQTDPARVISVLHRVLWSDSQPTGLRLWAMDRLIAHNEPDFWRIASRRIREVDQWPVLNPLIDKAVQRGDPKFTAALVRSLARTSMAYTDESRPERAAIEVLNPGQTLEQAVWGVFVSTDESMTTATRVDAWALTHRLAGAERTRHMLLETQSQHPLVLDLQSADWLDKLPVNREGILWLMRVRGEDEGAYWVHARELAKQLSDTQSIGLELRHLPVLMSVRSDVLEQDKASALASLTRRLSAITITPREVTGIAMRLPPEALSEHAASLCYADILTINRIVETLSDRALVATLFNQADQDLADTSTEYGGVLVDVKEHVTAELYPPDLRAHDQKFYSSNELIHRMYTGLAHYHFHAQKHANQAYAGPGLGDLKFVENLHANAVVFTFLDRDTLGVDYYQPGGVVVDLGVIRR